MNKSKVGMLLVWAGENLGHGRVRLGVIFMEIYFKPIRFGCTIPAIPGSEVDQSMLLNCSSGGEL